MVIHWLSRRSLQLKLARKILNARTGSDRPTKLREIGSVLANLLLKCISKMRHERELRRLVGLGKASNETHSLRTAMFQIKRSISDGKVGHGLLQIKGLPEEGEREKSGSGEMEVITVESSEEETASELEEENQLLRIIQQIGRK